MDFNKTLNNLTLSVIICTKDRLKDLTVSLDSIVSQSSIPDEIIIVDSSSNNLIREFINEYNKVHSKIIFKYIYTRPGLTHQRNKGTEIASGEIILFLDDDIKLDSYYLDHLKRVYEILPDEKTGGATGTLINPSSRGWVEKLLRKMFFLENDGNGKFTNAGYPTRVVNPGEIVAVEALPGFNMSFRKKIFREFSFDEKLEGYGLMEDDDFSWNVSRKYKLFQTPFAKIYHMLSAGGYSEEQFFYYLVRNNYYLCRKNKYSGQLTFFFFTWTLLGFMLLDLYSVIYNIYGGLRRVIMKLKVIVSVFSKPCVIW